MVYFDALHGTDLWIRYSFKGEKVGAFGFNSAASGSTALISPVVYMWTARNRMKAAETLASSWSGIFYSNGIPQLLHVLICPRCIQSLIHCLKYNVQNVWIDIKCKFEFKLNVLIRCAIKLGSNGWPNDRVDTQQKPSGSETMKSCPCEHSDRCWLED